MMDSGYISYGVALSVTEAVRTRRSLRAFTDDAVDPSVVSGILESAFRAPSGTNMQPWQVYVVRGETRKQLCDAVCVAFDERDKKYQGEERYYPKEWFEPYISRRRKVGWDLYGLLNIARGEHDKMHAQHRKNFQFFDAPVGLIFTIHRDLETGSWLDYGMFLQNVMLLAREQGLHTCPQAAWAEYHAVIRGVLPIGDEEVVVCGIALGFADSGAVENGLVTEREEVDSVCQFFE